MALRRLDLSLSYVLYTGRSNWLKLCGEKFSVTNRSTNTIKENTHQVCADGKRSVERSSRWIWNFWVPFIPSSAPNPCNGTFDVPVTNCRNFARSAWSKLRNARQNHWICIRDETRECDNTFTQIFFLIFRFVVTCIEFAWYLWYSVLAFRSSISTFGRPEISSSSSCSLNIEMSLLGMMS